MPHVHEAEDIELTQEQIDLIPVSTQQAMKERGIDINKAYVPTKTKSWLPKKHVFPFPAGDSVEADKKLGFMQILVPIFAILFHICVGSVYSLSVYNKPVEEMRPDFLKVSYLFSIEIALLGALGGFWGTLIEKLGSKATGFIAAVLFGLGNALCGVGLMVDLHFLYILGAIIAGLGLGAGYLSPVSPLLKWHMRNPGLGSGLAVGGFGLGASISSLLENYFIGEYGVDKCFIILGIIFFVVMFCSSFFLYVPPYKGWVRDRFLDESKMSEEDQKKNTQKKCCTDQDCVIGLGDAKFLPSDVQIGLKDGLKTPQFVFMWLILFINISCGIGVLSQLSPIAEDMFAMTADEAAGVVAFASIFNLLGRLVWATLSDYIGTRTVYLLYSAGASIIFFVLPLLAAAKASFVFMIVIAFEYSFYGGGFSTIPSFLFRTFGAKAVAELHGYVLSSWAVAALVAPTLVTLLSESASDLPADEKYNTALFIFACALIVEFILAVFFKPLTTKQFPHLGPKDEESEEEEEVVVIEVPEDEEVEETVEEAEEVVEEVEEAEEVVEEVEEAEEVVEEVEEAEEVVEEAEEAEEAEEF
ncbi:hypothetical protein PCE1_000128 [Barthelona sp. PCE]